ncbi:UNVERIFIED_CONTAM: hypothetical protein HDU68_008715 [Siphonaria sp. JEL0065]|nr:hypothetical protein HDU68_008715 [Siphonaria sp. JEL0065]
MCVYNQNTWTGTGYNSADTVIDAFSTLAVILICYKKFDSLKHAYKALIEKNILRSIVVISMDAFLIWTSENWSSQYLSWLAWFMQNYVLARALNWDLFWFPVAVTKCNCVKKGDPESAYSVASIASGLDQGELLGKNSAIGGGSVSMPESATVIRSASVKDLGVDSISLKPPGIKRENSTRDVQGVRDSDDEDGGDADSNEDSDKEDDKKEGGEEKVDLEGAETKIERATFIKTLIDHYGPSVADVIVDCCYIANDEDATTYTKLNLFGVSRQCLIPSTEILVPMPMAPANKPSLSCVAGKRSCVDPALTIADDGKCHNLQTDDWYCGTTTMNDPGSKLCYSGNLYDLTSDLNNCGTCENAVTASGGDIGCTGVPKNVQTDKENYGACGANVLTSGNNECCSGVPVNTNTDAAHCGSCSSASSISATSTGEVCCAGLCKNLTFNHSTVEPV